ncbi:hypothetical protein BLA29_007552, partial [Euroglyphus maynei]
PPPPPVVNPLTNDDRQRRKLQEELAANRKRLFNQIEQLKQRQKLHLANLHQVRRMLEASKQARQSKQRSKPNEMDNNVSTIQSPPLMNNDNILTIVTVAAAATITAVIATLLSIKYMF